MRILVAVLLLAVSTVAQTATPDNNTITVSLEVGRGTKFKLPPALPIGTTFHVRSDFPVTIAIVTPDKVRNMGFSRNDINLSPCIVRHVTAATLGCDKQAAILLVLDDRTKQDVQRDGFFGTLQNTVTVTRNIP